MTDGVFDVYLDPPNLVAEVNLSDRSDLAFTLEYDLAEVLNESIDGEIEVVDSHWHGLVIEDSAGETHHVDLRGVEEATDDLR